ncbi:hypothetical protein CAS74_003956 [Pichia kudriavzevii]|uniref:Uncharacterized protein n=1 Tax=Pichia kudriavzevii TaxID=4909 RepID=A0A1Z8JK47_PICKU|nr:hypothetical protein CAS74_003956 [Pichia kudriavzevii]
MSKHVKSQSTRAFENTSTNVAASQMRNHLNSLVDSVPESVPAEERQRFENEMDSFFALFRRYINEKSSVSNTLDWDKITSPSVDEVVSYKGLEENLNHPKNFDKLAVLN